MFGFKKINGRIIFNMRDLSEGIAVYTIGRAIHKCNGHGFVSVTLITEVTEESITILFSNKTEKTYSIYDVLEGKLIIRRVNVETGNDWLSELSKIEE